MTTSADEVAKLFCATHGQIGNAGGEIYPGHPGFVVAAASFVR